jgi:thiol-disulfide isomerase/thioredoxin
MKTLFLILLWCGLIAIEANAGPIKTTINCTIHGNNTSGLFLYQLKNGDAVSLGAKRPDKDGNCTFDVAVKEGIYFFKKAGGKGHEFKYTIYLKAGDQKKIDFYISNISIDYDSCLITKPNAETKSLQTWLNAMNEYSRAVTLKPSVGRTKYADFAKYSVAFLKSNKTGNPYFNTWLNDKVATDLKYLIAGNYFGFGRLNGVYDNEAEGQAFYKPLFNKSIINDVRLLRSEHGMELLDYVFGYWKFYEVKNQEKVVANYFSAENAAKIGRNEVKVAFLLHKMPGIKEYEIFVKYVEPYKSVFVSQEQKAVYDKLYNDLGPFAKGSPGYNFELKDVNDKTYTLAAFKGKVVIIDVWAMWCAPCLKEKPVMEKIAEGYKDRNDIVFIGMSVDGYAKKEAWKKFVKKNGFTSIELLSQFDESLFKFYKISVIPRFLIFDKAGRIVTVDAPLPSDVGFKKMVDATLSAK